MQSFRLALALSFLFVASLLAACSAPPPSPEAAATALKPFTADIEKLIADTRTALTPLSQLPVAQGNDAAACTTVMADKLKGYTQYTTFGAAHLDGTLFCTSQPQTTPANILDRDYFKRAIQTRDLAVGVYQIGKVTNKKSVGIGLPILDGSNNPQGIVLSPVDLDWLNQHLATISLPAGAEFILLDSESNLLARVPNAPDQVGKYVGDSAIAGAMFSQLDGSCDCAGTDGVARIYKFTVPQGSNKLWLVALGLKK